MKRNSSFSFKRVIVLFGIAITMLLLGERLLVRHANKARAVHSQRLRSALEIQAAVLGYIQVHNTAPKNFTDLTVFFKNSPIAKKRSTRSASPSWETSTAISGTGENSDDAYYVWHVTTSSADTVFIEENPRRIQGRRFKITNNGALLFE